MFIDAIIVDDETLDRGLLKSLIEEYCSKFRIVGEASNIKDATLLIKKLEAKIVFLDIQMINESGFTLLNYFPKRNFEVVFTTGHDEYGIKAVKVGAFDYLMKPIDVDELIDLENKMIAKIQYNYYKPSNKPRLIVYHNKERIYIDEEDIICIEGQGSYSKIYYLKGKQKLVSKNLSQILEEIQSDFLVRVHRSFIINTNKITARKTLGYELLLDLEFGIEASVSRKYRKLIKEI